jgi:hypothetical protein
MTTETPVDTLTESLSRLLLSLRQQQPPRRSALNSPWSVVHGLRSVVCRLRSVVYPPTSHRPPGRIPLPPPTLGNGQMLLPGIAEPRLWS